MLVAPRLGATAPYDAPAAALSMPMFFKETYGGALSDRTPEGLDRALSAEAFADAHQRGVKMTYDEVVAFALEELERVADLPDGSMPTRS